MTMWPETLPVLFATNSLLFPGGMLPFHPRSRGQLAALMAAATSDDDPLAVLMAAPAANARWQTLGTVVRVVALGQRPCCEQWVAELVGIDRARIVAPCQTHPFVTVRCTPVIDIAEDPAKLHALASAIADVAVKMGQRFPECFHVQRAHERIRAVQAPKEFCGAVASLLLHIPLGEQQQILELEPLSARLESVLGHVHAFLARDLGSHFMVN